MTMHDSLPVEQVADRLSAASETNPADLKAIAQRYVAQAFAVAVKALGSKNEAVSIRACEIILDRALGKVVAAQTVAAPQQVTIKLVQADLKI